MSRRSPRYRIDTAATAISLLGGEMAVCRTLDVSDDGVSLDTAAWFPIGTRLAVALVDPVTGSAIELTGDVVREAIAPSWTLGVLLIDPPVEWRAFVASAARKAPTSALKPTKRLRVLVFGDEQRRRGAMALYVTSGWDVLFATDAESIAEPLAHIELDAVVAELDAADPRVAVVMADVRRWQPMARRIVRGASGPHTELVHRFIDRDAGLDVLLDAVTAHLAAR